MKILGIDPGSVVMGFGVIQIINSKIIPVEYGAIKLDKKQSLPSKLCTIFDEICAVITKNSPDIICVESTFFGKNAATAAILGQARGAAIAAVGKFNADFKEFSPKEIKKAVTGNGAATKEQVEYMIRAILSLPNDKIENDAFDALACAVCGWNHHNFYSKI